VAGRTFRPLQRLHLTDTREAAVLYKEQIPDPKIETGKRALQEMTLDLSIE
jgi:hypothetical protein